MLQLLPCPHCGQQSLLPNDTPLEASLKCPHCGQELVLGEALLEQFSSWEVVSDPAASVPTSESPVSHLTERSNVATQSDPMDEALELVESVEKTAPVAPAVSVRPYTHFEYERMRRKQKSPIWSVLPVVLGGLAAFPIALLILWYGLGRDVGDMGPKIAAFAPWIVPKEFHPAGNLPLPNRPRTVPQSGESGLPQVGEDTGSLQPQIVPEADSVDATIDRKTVKIQSVEKQPMASEESTVKPNLPTEPSANTPSDEQTLPENQNLFLSIREAKELLAELVKAREPTTPESERISTERQNENFRSAYERLATVATFCSQIDPANPVHRTIRERMQPIARMIQQSPELQEVFDKVATGRVTKKTSVGFSGIALTIDNIDVKRQSDFWIVTGNHPLAKETIIEIPRTLAHNPISGEGLFVLGVLVPNGSSSEPAIPKLRVSYLHSL